MSADVIRIKPPRPVITCENRSQYEGIRSAVALMIRGHYEAVTARNRQEQAEALHARAMEVQREFALRRR